MFQDSRPTATKSGLVPDHELATAVNAVIPLGTSLTLSRVATGTPSIMLIWLVGS